MNRLRAFLILWVGQAFSLLGSELAHFALIWWLTRTTGSPTTLALASMVGLLPQVVLGPIAGVLVDRWSRRAVMLAADALVALSTLFLGYLFWIDAATVPFVFGVLFLRALGSTFHWPAMQASTTLMVPDRRLTRIQGMDQALYGGLRIVAAPAGALLLEWIDVAGVIALDVSTALLAILPLLFIAIPRPESQPSAARGLSVIRQDLGEGLRYVRGRPALLLMMGQALIVNLVMTPCFALLPILVTSHFAGEALQLAWLQAAFSVGLLTGGLLLGAWGGFRRRIYTTLFGLMGVGTGMLLVASAPATLLPLAIGGLVLVGVMLSLTNGPVNAILQSTVAPEMQGRVFMLLRSLASLIAPLGLSLAGPLSELVGVRFWFFASGIVTLLVALAGSFNRVLLAVEDSPAPPVAAIATPAD
jgi:DHA3 family macrolide efflux protein-like MFS transporter